MLRKLLFEKTDNSFVQFLRSVVVGTIATVVDMAVLALFVEAFSMNLYIATAIGFIAGLITNFLLSSLWVFEKSKVVKSRTTEFVIFAFIGVIGLIINELIVNFFDSHVADFRIFGAWLPEDKYYLVGKLAATVVAFVWNFGARKLLLYKKKDDGGAL